ncbi:endonuclease III [Phascolarctobacterium sp.]|uniref:endonuclease III n=1 Tax=Phascolarctobacterium sp. TaxID=2049039 RepID=UPI002A7F2650|nr:endonuclease III [Phascolarctobacterium sp.]MDY5044508.1 endonuclease III [Phascolarctobacterium sp.]MEE1193725.1 endonuclease III [Phascolarctobacterium sp.]
MARPLTKAQKQVILAKLEETYKDTKTALNYNSPFELLVAVILSAQCTDERVNVITARLFPRLNTPEKMGALTQEQMEEEIRDCGLYHAKAKNILGACHMLVERFNSTIPSDIKTLMELPGVGQKTANVVASIIYNVPAIAVDTHVFRVSHRLGMAKGADPLATEKELQKAIPMEKWSDAHHWFIWHGRKICKARKPLCSQCVLLEECPFKEKNLE